MDRSDQLIIFLDNIEFNPDRIPKSINKFPVAEDDDVLILEHYFNKPISWLKEVIFKIMARDLPKHLDYGRIVYFIDSPRPEIKELANELLVIRNTGNSQEKITEAVNKILV